MAELVRHSSMLFLHGCGFDSRLPPSFPFCPSPSCAPPPLTTTIGTLNYTPRYTYHGARPRPRHMCSYKRRHRAIHSTEGVHGSMSRLTRATPLCRTTPRTLIHCGRYTVCRGRTVALPWHRRCIMSLRPSSPSSLI